MASVSDLGIDQIDLVSTSCGGASHAPGPACSGVHRRRLTKKLERTFAGSKSVTFKGKELPLEEPWISPETNDMEKFELPCCKQAIKIDEKWSGEVHCFLVDFLMIKISRFNSIRSILA